MQPHSLMELILTLSGIAVLAYFFAQVEIHIEGEGGWAANLPTWRIEEHWLLTLFWGGRPMTGYHAWVFSFICLFFHFPLAFMARWSWELEARVVASAMLFWILEDFLWFILNPAYGLKRFRRGNIAWHKRWMWGAPVDYWLFSAISAVLFWYAY